MWKATEMPSSTTPDNRSNQNSSRNTVVTRPETVSVSASVSNQWQSKEKNGKMNQKLDQLKQTINNYLRCFNPQASDVEINKTRRRILHAVLKYEADEELVSSNKIRKVENPKASVATHNPVSDENVNEHKFKKPKPKSKKRKELVPKRIIKKTIESNKAKGVKVPNELLRLIDTDEFCSSPPRNSKRKCQKIQRFSLEKYEQPKRTRRKSCSSISNDIQHSESHTQRAVLTPQIFEQTPAKIYIQNKKLPKPIITVTDFEVTANQSARIKHEAKKSAKNEHVVIANKSAGSSSG